MLKLYRFGPLVRGNRPGQFALSLTLDVVIGQNPAMSGRVTTNLVVLEAFGDIF